MEEPLFDWEVDLNDGGQLRIRVWRGGQLTIESGLLTELITPEDTAILIEALRDAHAVQTGEVTDHGRTRIGY